MTELKWTKWNGFDIPLGNPPISEDFDIPPELVDKINKSVSINEVNELLNDFNHTKDVVFKMGSPFDMGPQDSTDIPYPHNGITKYAIMSVSSDSVMISNIIVSIEKYDKVNDVWIPISGMMQMNIGQGLIVKEFTHEIKEKDRLRINLMEGKMEGIKDLTIILNIE